MLSFSLKKKTMSKITIDNSVRYIPISKKRKKEKLYQKQENMVHFLINKTKNFHKITKNSLKM